MLIDVSGWWIIHAGLWLAAGLHSLAGGEPTPPAPGPSTASAPAAASKDRAPAARVTIVTHRFRPEEDWRLRAHGPAGHSEMSGRILRLDFSEGAEAFSLVPPDRTIPGSVERLRLRANGSLRGLPVRVSLRTHFMNFHRLWGRFEGDGHLELSVAGPPGPGWEWSGGENDGKLHGPLRLGEIRFERPSGGGEVVLELEEVAIDASCPETKRCLAHADWFETPTGPAFQFTARAMLEAPLPARVHWTMRNWEGEVLARGTGGLELQSHAVPTRLELPLPAGARERWRFVEAEFQLESAGQEVAPVQSAWVSPMEDEGDAVLRPDSPFGMGAYFYRYPDTTEGYAEMERAAAVARRAGVKWSREEFQWGRIEPRRGEFDWDFYDRLVATARSNGIQVYAIVAYWSGWTKPYTSEGIADYVRFLEALVRRYGREIRQWEIWNEPNIFFWQGPRELYAELLKRSYAAVKAIDPNAEVLGLSTAGIDFDYIQRMLDLEAPFDILTIHPYRRTLEDPSFLDDLRRVSRLVRRADGRARPVWLTELGWPTFSPHNAHGQDFAPTSLRAQAELMVRCYLLSMVSGIEPRTFWYNFRDDGEDPFYCEHRFGIVDRRFRPKPAYRTYAVMARMLAGLEPGGQLELGEGTLAWRFVEGGSGGGLAAGRNSGRGVTVLWNPERDIEVALPWPGPAARLVNAVGETRPLREDNGRVHVPLRRGAVIYQLE